MSLSREGEFLHNSRLLKLPETALVESFNARVRAECMNAQVFKSDEDAKNILTS